MPLIMSWAAQFSKVSVSKGAVCYATNIVVIQSVQYYFLRCVGLVGGWVGSRYWLIVAASGTFTCWHLISPRRRIVSVAINTLHVHCGKSKLYFLVDRTIVVPSERLQLKAVHWHCKEKWNVLKHSRINNWRVIHIVCFSVPSKYADVTDEGNFKDDY